MKNNNYEKRIFVRKEENGITVYNQDIGRISFYENMKEEDLHHEFAEGCIEAVQNNLRNNANRTNLNVNITKPLNINWLIEDKCNLDCIYCFAHNKLNILHNKEKIISTAKRILELNPLTVTLSGGEPTLNPFLPEILKLFDGKVATILDTNGTLLGLERIVSILKETNTLVRITIDSIEHEIAKIVRPAKNNPDKNTIDTIMRNITLLKSQGIPVMIHTVLTQKNIKKVYQIGYELMKHDIKRWHLYAVNYTEKCKDFYHSIEVTYDDILANQRELLELFGDKIYISHSLQTDFAANAVLLVNCNGEFFVDTVTEGVKYIGVNPKRPTDIEIYSALDWGRHKQCYLSYINN